MGPTRLTGESWENVKLARPISVSTCDSQRAIDRWNSAVGTNISMVGWQGNGRAAKCVCIILRGIDVCISCKDPTIFARDKHQSMVDNAREGESTLPVQCSMSI